MAITNGYATLNELKRFVSVDVNSTAHDDDLERSVESASRAIDRYTGRFFYDTGAATARVFRPEYSRWLFVGDFHTTTGLVVKTDTDYDGTYETTWAATDYQTEPLVPKEGFPWDQLVALDSVVFPRHLRRATVEVTASWGWSAVPTDVAQTCLILAAEYWKRKDAPFGVAGFGGDGLAVRVGSDEAVLSRLRRFRRTQVA